MNSKKDYYKVLQVSPTATQAEIRGAYHRLALQNHPDKNPGMRSSTQMQEINEAYSVLGNPQKRNKYDFERSDPYPKREDNAARGNDNATVKERMPANPFSASHKMDDPGDSLKTIIPSQKRWFLIFFIGFWLVGWVSGEVTALNSLISGINSGEFSLFMIVWLGGWTIGGGLAAYILFWQIFGIVNESKCPKCNRLWTAEILEQKLLGIFNTRERGYGENKQISWEEKYRIRCRCTHCGHEWEFTKVKAQ
ncbi:Chaperone protein DnaJ [Anaerolineales bacterium]|nr:Chaperone protein DnaJ [Anaerolineales bacterium]